ncbi:MAG: L-2-hydroxyglutarate oxidase [Acidimicrobiia bacterium]
MADVVVIGGGIVGLATALAVTDRFPGAGVTVIEKEPDLAHHQTGNNSGVLHSGLYYKPGSLKATYCRDGNRALIEFCQEHGIAYDICGKLVVATEDDELPRLDDLVARAEAHGLAYERLGPDGLRAHEPNVAGIAGLFLPSTGITDYVAVVRKYAEIVQSRGGTIQLGTTVTSIRREGDEHIVATTNGEIRAGALVNCAGLQSDRVARMAGASPDAKIVPFRGEYYELAPDARHLVNGLIYPVPDPSFPFLGVHFTKMINGDVHAGPNAVLALKREGYTKLDINVRDTFETLTYPGFLRLARKHFGAGMQEVFRSFSKRLFLKSLQRLVPDVRRGDLVPTHAGVRAQALTPEGGLVDDFLIVEGHGALHVCNAPSPAATSSLEIGKAIAARLALASLSR